MKYLRRLVWFLTSHLLAVAIIAGLMVTTFYYAMNLTNIYIVLKDGMARRAQVAMLMAEPSDLNKYFQTGFLSSDPVVQAVQSSSSPYQDYRVRGIDHRLEISFAWVWPWDDTVRVDITERIPRIDGRAKGDKAEALVSAYGSSALYPPAWQSARYRAVLSRDHGQWLIKSLSLIENLTEE